MGRGNGLFRVRILGWSFDILERRLLSGLAFWKSHLAENFGVGTDNKSMV